MELQLLNVDTEEECEYVVLMLRDGAEGADAARLSAVRTENNIQVRKIREMKQRGRAQPACERVRVRPRALSHAHAGCP